MHTLSVEESEENGLSFELLVDGTPLRVLVSGASGGIPYWIVEDDLPYFPTTSDEAARRSDLRIVAVCSCGEYGCGHTRCRVVKDGESVVFSGFITNVNAADETHTFRFFRLNYDAVLANMVAAAAAQRNKNT